MSQSELTITVSLSLKYFVIPSFSIDKFSRVPNTSRCEVPTFVTTPICGLTISASSLMCTDSPAPISITAASISSSNPNTVSGTP